MSDTRSLWRRNPLRGRFLAAGETPASILCLPNVISLVRIALIPVFLWLLLADAVQQVCTASLPPICGDVVPWPLEASNGPMRWAAAIVFILAIATDAIDGHLARSRNLVTDLGIFLDPVADKGITGAALIGLALLGELPCWAVAVILLREIGITVYRAVALRDRVIPASRGGKLKTLVQAVAISYWLVPFAALVAWDDAAGASAGNLLVLALDAVHWILLVLVVAVTLWTGIDYLVQGARAARLGSGAAAADGADGTNARRADDDAAHGSESVG